MANYPIAISYAILAGTSIYCLNKLHYNALSIYGTYGIMLVNSCLGTLKFITDEHRDDRTIDSLYEITSFLQNIFVPPYGVAAVLIANGYTFQLAQLYFSLPIVPMFIKYYQNEPTDQAVNAIVALSSVTLGLVSYEVGSIFGVFAAALYAISHFITGAKEPRLNRASYLDLFNIDLSIFEYLMLIVLTKKAGGT